MRVDAPQALEPPCAFPESRQVGYEDSILISHNHIGNLALARNKCSYLAVDFPGNRGYLANEFAGGNVARRHSPGVETLKSFMLVGLESAYFAENLFDGCRPLPLLMDNDTG